MTVIAGIAVDALGAASHTEAVRTAPSDPLAFRTRQVFSSLPAEDIDVEQPSWVPLDRDHDDRPVGVVRHLERDGRGNVWAVARLDDPSVDPAGMAFSIYAHRRGWRSDTPWVIDSISLTNRPAMHCIGTVKVIDVSDVDAISERWVLRTRTHEAYFAALLQRAKDTARTRRRDAALVVHDTDERRGAAREQRKIDELEFLEQQIAALEGHPGIVSARSAGGLRHSAPYAGIISVR